jgi:hypothetical protein
MPVGKRRKVRSCTGKQGDEGSTRIQGNKNESFQSENGLSTQAQADFAMCSFSAQVNKAKEEEKWSLTDMIVGHQPNLQLLSKTWPDTLHVSMRKT